MKRLHKLIVLVLSVSLLLGVIVVSAFASDTVAKIGDDEYSSLSEAFAAANGQQADGAPAPVTVTLVKDVVLSKGEVLSVDLGGLAVTLDLAGHTLDVSFVGTTNASAMAAMYVRGEGATLNVVDGEIINNSASFGVFAIEDGKDAELNIEGVTVNARGAGAAPILNARSGKTTVADSEFVTYGASSIVIRQANDAEIIVNESVLMNIEGSSGLSGVIKLDGTATGKLFEEIIPESDGDEPAGDEPAGDEPIDDPDPIIVERPHVVLDDCDIYAAANVFLGVLSSETRPAGKSSTWVAVENCRIEQCNDPKYNEDSKLCPLNNNRVLKGDCFDIDFESCSVEYARVAFDTNLNQNITVNNCSFSMTNLGQEYYLDPTKSEKTSCESYFVMGRGNVSVKNTSIYLPQIFEGVWAAIADDVAIAYAKSLDLIASGGLEIGEGCATNSMSNIKEMGILELGCRTIEIAKDQDKGYYIGYKAHEADIWSGNWYSDKSYAAKLNGVKYSSFDEAYAAAAPGDKIQLLADVEGIKVIDKPISVMNFGGYEFKHTSATYKASFSRGYVNFTEAKYFELVKVVLVTVDGEEEMTVAAGNYANYSGVIREGWYLDGYKRVRFLGWGETPGDYSLGANLPFIDGSSSTVKIYGEYEVDCNFEAEYFVETFDGEFVEWGGKFSDLTETDQLFKHEGNVIVLLKDIYLEKSAETFFYGKVFIDLNGFKITTNNVPLIKSARLLDVHQVDADGKLVRIYNTSYAKVYDVTYDGNGNEIRTLVTDKRYYSSTASNDYKIKDDAWGEGHKLVIPDYATKSSGSMNTYFCIFSSRPGGEVDTGSAEVFNAYSEGKMSITSPDGIKISLSVNFTYFVTGNAKLNDSKLNAAELQERLGDDKVKFTCRALVDGYGSYSHYTWVDDAYVVGTEKTYGLLGVNSYKGINGYNEISNSIFYNTTPGASVISVGPCKHFWATDCVFIATPGADGKYPCALYEMGHDATEPTDTVTFRNCAFIDCLASYTKKYSTFKGQDFIYENVYYNVPGALTAANAIKLGPDVKVDESAKWNYAVEIAGTTFYLPYRAFSSTVPGTFNITWKAEGETDVTETYFVGANVVYNGGILPGDATVAGKPYINLMKYAYALEDGTPVDLDSINSDTVIVVTEVADGIKADVTGVRYNVTISDDLTLSVLIPVNDAITKISLMTPDNANLIELQGGELLTTADGNYYKISAQNISPNKIHTKFTYAITVSDGANTDVAYITVSVLDYLTDLISDGSAAAELKAVANALLIYSAEAYKLFDGAVNEDVAALAGSYTLSAPEASVVKSVDDIRASILTVSLRINSRAAFIFEVADGVESIEINGVTCAVVDGVATYEVDVIDANAALNITVGGASGTYDLLAYIGAIGTESDSYGVAVALNAFAIAVAAYVATLA